MKKLLRIPLLLVALLLSSIPISAHDFEVDGIYYNITDATAKTVEVTFKGDRYDSSSDEYLGTATIPETVIYSGTTYSVTSIAEKAFCGCTRLYSVTIPNSVTSISYEAFRYCTYLTLVTIPSSVTEIGYEAFYDTPWYNNKPNGLVYINNVLYNYKGEMSVGTKIEVADGTVSISPYAFLRCTGLTSVTIPNTVTSIGYGAFYGCTRLYSVNIPNSLTEIESSVFGNCGFSSITIPESVTSIGDEAFSGCEELTSITIPESVTSISIKAFKGCSKLETCYFNAINCSITGTETDSYNVFYDRGLKTLIIGENVINIPDRTFKNIKTLQSVAFGNSVASISENAFLGCDELTTITIPNSVTSIGSNAFAYCDKLATVKFNATNCTKMGAYSSPVFEECPAFKTLKIGENVTKIPAYAFKQCNSLTSVTIPDAVTSIGNMAFAECAGLTEVTFNAINCKSMGDANYPVFSGCSALKELSIGNKVTKIPSYALYRCESLTSVYIGNSVTSIENRAFYNCVNLTTVSMGNSSVELIGPNAFCQCVKLTSITIPESLSRIETKAFYGCPFTTIILKRDIPPTLQSDSFSEYNAELNVPLGSIRMYQTSDYWRNFSNIIAERGVSGDLIYSKISDTEVKVCGLATNVSEVIIPSSVTFDKNTYTVTEIDGSAFFNCSDLTTITIPSSIKTIGLNAFKYCTALTTINFNATNCVSMGDSNNSVFSGCTSLTTLNIGDEVTNIPSYAFAGCTGLTSVTIPNGVTQIGSYVFSGCTSLTTLNIGDNVTNIPSYAFSRCSGLTSVTIPKGVTQIGSYAFGDCTSLTTVNFNAINCTSMGDSSNSAFSGCASLTTLNIGEDVTNIPSYAFYGCNKIEAIAIPRGVIQIGNSAFGNCTSLTTVNFNATNCASMGYSSNPVFSGCTSFTTLNIGDNVTNIPSYAFYGCTKLTSLVVPNSVTSIYQASFSGCIGLKTVDLGNGVEYLGSDAFYGCKKISSLSIPSSVTKIGAEAFYNCSSIASLSGGKNLKSIETDAFWGCDELVNSSSSTTQTTATVRLTTPTRYNVGLYSDSNKMQANDGEVVFTGLRPNRTISEYDLALIINDIYCPIKDLSFKTLSFSASVTGSATATSISAIGTYTDGDVTILGEGINYGSSVTNYDGNNTITVSNLDPDSRYTIYYAVNTQEGGAYGASKTFTTEELDLTTQEAKPTSTTSVRLLASTNCDATEGTGFEWRRYDAPAELPSSKVSCPVVDGVLVGSLRGVASDAYYKYRPYYTSSSGNTYYGEWIAFFTGDANVYFEPEVRTYDDIQVIQNSAVVKGYALEGTDVIIAQGFEYWKTGTIIMPASTDERMTVNASGISMSATLSNLEYNSTYKYRAFVTTAKGTVYGDEMEFSTGEDPAGIGYIEMDSKELTVTLRENPATGTAWVKIAGVAGEKVKYVITSMGGVMVATGDVLLAGEWNAIDLNCSAGMYLLTINDGSQVKTLRLIVK